MTGVTTVEMTDNRRNSFDEVRLAAALMVLIDHFYGMSDRVAPLTGLWGTDEDLGGFAVLIFFGLSGYLITDSILRGANFRFYVASRLLRIYPALLVCLVIGIFVGALITELSLAQYLSAQVAQFFFGNIFPIFWREERSLPGVFSSYYWQTFNGPLWTIKYELACYAVTLCVFMVSRSRRWLAFGALFAIAAGMWWVPFQSWQIPQGNTVLMFEYFNMGFFRYYLAIFMLAAVVRIIVGNVSYRWFGVFFACGVVLAFFQGLPLGDLALLGGIALAGVCLGGSSLLYFGGVYRKYAGDLSYATYLYGWPISDMCVNTLTPQVGFWPSMMIATVSTLAVAWVSWKLIERPMLGLKRLIPRDPPRTIAGSIARPTTSSL